jgi:hypothetical protein
MTGKVARMKEIRNAKIFQSGLEETDRLGDVGIDGSIM